MVVYGQSCFAAKPRLIPYPADSASNTGIAVVVCPGGSYSWLDMPTEGRGVAQWLQSQGINAFVLRYHVANVSAYITGYRVLGLGNHYPKMLTDVEEALRQVYSMADSLNIDTAKIGVMGFSAGGHLTMMSYTHNRTAYKPHFLCPMYPVVTFSDKRYVHTRSRRGALGVWGQWRQPMRDSLSIERRITPSCPPVFLVNCVDDPSSNTRTPSCWTQPLRRTKYRIPIFNIRPEDTDSGLRKQKEQMNHDNGKKHFYNGYRV